MLVLWRIGTVKFSLIAKAGCWPSIMITWGRDKQNPDGFRLSATLKRNGSSFFPSEARLSPSWLHALQLISQMLTKPVANNFFLPLSQSGITFSHCN